MEYEVEALPGASKPTSEEHGMMRSFAATALAAALAGSTTAAQAPFTEEGLARGVTYFTQHFVWSGFGYGAVLADIDGDGSPDALPMGGFMDLPGLFLNDGSGFFTDASAGSNLPAVTFSSGALAFDYDADGDLDVFFTSFGSRDVMARNEGDGTFTDVSQPLGVNNTGHGGGAAAGDVNGDGWLDLHVSNYGDADYYYENQGGAAFTELGASLGLNSSWRALQSVFFDMDRDGDADLYVSVDKKDPDEVVQHNLLFENVNGVLVDVSSGSGADVNIFSMGVAVGAYAGDGLPDLYNANLPDEPAPFLENTGNGRFRDTTAKWGIGNFRLAWGTTFLDYDNDTHTDLYVLNSIDTDPRNRLYVHGGMAPAIDIASQLGLDSPLDSYTSAIGDIDNDGDLDFLVEEANNWIQLYVNREGDANQNSWVKLRLVSGGRNPFAVGAHVSVRTGAKWQYRELMVGGNGYKSTNDYTVHFGLDQANRIDEVRVRWPDGRTHRMRDLAVNRTYSVRRKINLRDPPSGPVRNF